MTTQTTLTGLSPLNVRAIEETISDRLVLCTRTTATFALSPEKALQVVESTIAHLDGRGHPKASLHAVRRRLAKQADLAARFPSSLDDDLTEDDHLDATSALGDDGEFGGGS